MKLLFGAAAVLVVGWVGWGIGGGHWPTTAASGVAPVAKEHAPPPAAPPRSLWLRAVGDIQLDRGVERGYTRADFSVLFAAARPLLREPDLTFGNLESPVAHGGKHQGGVIAFRAHPNVLMPLADAGFDVLSLANNHAHDYGRDALLETAQRLRTYGMIPVGAREGNVPRAQAQIIERGGLRIAFLAYATFACCDAVVRLGESTQRMAEDVGAVRNQADLVFVSFHWGEEYKHVANDEQKKLGWAAVDAGADLVIGHHPHVVQGVERYRNKVIVYSLGNFIFDQPWDHTRNGLLLDWRYEEGSEPQVRLYPVRIDPEPYRVRIPLGDEATRILTQVQELTAALGTSSERDGNTLLVGGALPSESTAASAP